MHRTLFTSLFVILGLAVALTAQADMGDSAMQASGDARQPVPMPPAMHVHMLANMRDHLVAMGEIQAALAAGKYDHAADIAETRIGLSSLEAHNASHMAPYMPKPMQELGMTMHRAASRFARIAQETAVDNNLPRALGALADLTQKCAACHASYRVH